MTGARFVINAIKAAEKCPICGKRYHKKVNGDYIHYTETSHTVCNDPKKNDK